MERMHHPALERDAVHPALAAVASSSISMQQNGGGPVSPKAAEAWTPAAKDGWEQKGCRIWAQLASLEQFLA